MFICFPLAFQDQDSCMLFCRFSVFQKYPHLMIDLTHATISDYSHSGTLYKLYVTHRMATPLTPI